MKIVRRFEAGKVQGQQVLAQFRKFAHRSGWYLILLGLLDRLRFWRSLAWFLGFQGSDRRPGGDHRQVRCALWRGCFWHACDRQCREFTVRSGYRHRSLHFLLPFGCSPARGTLLRVLSAQHFLQRGLVRVREPDDIWITLFWFFSQGFQEDRVQFFWQERIDGAWRCRWRMVMMMQKLGRGSLEDRAASDQLVDHHRQRILVRGGTNMNRGGQGRIIELFRSHIKRRTNGAMQRAPAAVKRGQAKIRQQKMRPAL